MSDVWSVQSQASTGAQPSSPAPQQPCSPPAVFVSSPQATSDVSTGPTAPPLNHRGYSLEVPGEAEQREQHDHTDRHSVRSDRRSVTTRATGARSPGGLSAVTAKDFHDLSQIFQIVADRRATFDGLLWGVPSTSFAAQAFLFQTGLAGDSTSEARIVSMALSILVTLLTIQLFTRQLQAEDADHRWLEDWEARHGVDPEDRAHGDTWRAYRSELPRRARCFAPLANIRGFTLWSNGMLCIGVIAAYVLVRAAVDPGAFQTAEVCGGRSS